MASSELDSFLFCQREYLHSKRWRKEFAASRKVPEKWQNKWFCRMLLVFHLLGLHCSCPCQQTAFFQWEHVQFCQQHCTYKMMGAVLEGNWNSICFNDSSLFNKKNIIIGFCWKSKSSCAQIACASLLFLRGDLRFGVPSSVALQVQEWLIKQQLIYSLQEQRGSTC